jgi:hypothetical protein
MRWAVAGIVALGLQTPDAARTYGVGETAVTRAIELRVEGVETLAEIGGRRARPGYEFLVVDTTWKNIIPLTAIDKKAASSPTGGLSGFGAGRRPASQPGDVTMEPTKYVVSMLRRQAWVFSDDRYGDTLDPEAQEAIAGHLPVEQFSIATLDEIVRGKLVFEVPAAAKHRILQYYDAGFGHVAFRLAGSKPSAPPAVGAPGANGVLRLVLSEAAARPASVRDPPGSRTYVVGVRGSSLSIKDIVDVPFQQFVFLMNEHGCVAQPLREPEGLSRPFGAVGSFPPTGANEGPLAFLLPEGSRSLKLLVRPAQGGPIDLAAGEDFTPTWPAPVHTFQDGSTMKVHLLPAPQRPATLAAGEGRQVLLDVAVENLSKSRGIEFQPLQLRLALPGGGFIDPSPVSGSVPCRLDGDGVVPAGGVRRFLLVYDVAAEGRPRVNFRGFELNEATAELP